MLVDEVAVEPPCPNVMDEAPRNLATFRQRRLEGDGLSGSTGKYLCWRQDGGVCRGSRRYQMPLITNSWRAGFAPAAECSRFPNVGRPSPAVCSVQRAALMPRAQCDALRVKGSGTSASLVAVAVSIAITGISLRLGYGTYQHHIKGTVPFLPSVRHLSDSESAVQIYSSVSAAPTAQSLPSASHSPTRRPRGPPCHAP